MDTYTYKIGENLYVNLTNRCSNNCTFCVRNGKERYEGYALWLKEEPTAEQVIDLIGDPKRYREIVFCGFGEPTYRLETMTSIADAVHARGGKTRLNTNGHGNLINGRDISRDLLGRIDLVNVSLNAPDGAGYAAVCRPQLAGATLQTVIDFARALKSSGVPCLFSVVDCIGEAAVEQCRGIARLTGIPLRVREMIE